MSQRTRTHYYPAEEVTAMQNKYGGKRCIYSQRDAAVEWSHQLDAALDSTRRLEWMLARNLRQDRHPLHATEVRENLVPVSVELHARSNRGVPTLTLFPHVEDVLARSLEYELQIASPRCKQGALPPYEVGYDASESPAGCSHSPSSILCSQSPLWSSTKPHALYPCRPSRQISPRFLVIMQLWSWDPDVVAGPQGVAVAASNNIFQDVPSIASRTATLETISSRIVEVQAFAPGPAPAPSLEQTDASGDVDSDSESVCGDGSSSNSGEFGCWDNNTQFFVGSTTNDTPMASGHLDPGLYLYVQSLRISDFISSFLQSFPSTVQIPQDTP